MTAENYTHPTTINGVQARAFARLCLRRMQPFALRPDGRRWVVMAPAIHKDAVIQLIEDAKEP